MGWITWGNLGDTLSIPPVPERNTIVIITYLIVVFSIVVQGISLGKLVVRIYPRVHGNFSGENL